jgi:hypothetical protein
LKCVLQPQNIACHTITGCQSALEIFCKCGNHKFNVLRPSRYDPKVRYRGKLNEEKLPQLHQSRFDHVGYTANGGKSSTIQCKFEGMCLSLTDIYFFLSIFNNIEPLDHSKVAFQDSSLMSSTWRANSGLITPFFPSNSRRELLGIMLRNRS